jgi:hypothetical protein
MNRASHALGLLLAVSLAFAGSDASAQGKPAGQQREEASRSASDDGGEDTSQPSDYGARLKQARKLFERGLELSEGDRWGEALELFKRSRMLIERPATVFNLATVLFRLGRPKEALRAIDDYFELEDTGDKANKRREMARQLRADLQNMLSTLILTVNPTHAQVRVDGRSIDGSGRNRRIVLNPGTHLLTVRADGHTSHLGRVSALAGETITRQVPLSPLQATVSVHTGTDDAAIFVGDEQVGQGQATVQLPRGQHEVRVRSGGDTVRRRIDVSAGQRLTVQAEPEPPLYKQPVVWVLVGVALAAAGAAAGLTVALRDEGPYGGTLNETVRVPAPR